MQHIGTSAAFDRIAVPDIYSLPAYAPDVFAVPVPDAVGTNSIGNAVSVLHLEQGGLRTERVLVDFVKYVSAGDQFFLAPVSEHRIAYTQGRRLVLLDIVDKSFVLHTVTRSLKELIQGVQIVDAAAHILAFEMQRRENMYGSALRDILLCDLSGDSAHELARRNVGKDSYAYRPPWTVAGDAILVCDESGQRIDAYDLRLRPTTHPLAKLCNEKSRSRPIIELAVHPRRSFAVLVDRAPVRNENYMVWVAQWGCDEPRIVPLPGVNRNGLYCSRFEFSPDGSWLVYRDETKDDRNPVLMAVPVEPDSRARFGKPVKLGTVLNGEPTSTCWVQEPLSFVACNGTALYRWRLDRM